jgi:hypothetical protein
MALGEARQVFHTNSECTSSGVAERGGIMSYVPGVNGLCRYLDSTAVSGAVALPAGLLLGDIEALNFMRHPQYRQRNVEPEGSVVALATEGEFWTDMVETTTVDGASVGTYIPGDTLYLADNGQVSRLNVLGIRPVVGKALSAVNADGFLQVRIEL